MQRGKSGIQSVTVTTAKVFSFPQTPPPFFFCSSIVAKIPIPSLFAERNEGRGGGGGLSEDERCPKTRNESLPRLRGIHPFFADIFSLYQARNNKVHINKKNRLSRR